MVKHDSDFLAWPLYLQKTAILLSVGLNNQEIQEFLSLAHGTVGNYVCEIKKLVGSKNRTALVLDLEDFIPSRLPYNLRRLRAAAREFVDENTAQH